MFHSDDSAIALRVGMNVHVPKETKERDPEDEEDQIPDEGERDARRERDEVEDGRNSREGGHYFCVDPFSIAVLVLLVCFV